MSEQKTGEHGPILWDGAGHVTVVIDLCVIADLVHSEERSVNSNGVINGPVRLFVTSGLSVKTAD